MYLGSSCASIKVKLSIWTA